MQKAPLPLDDLPEHVLECILCHVAWSSSPPSALCTLMRVNRTWHSLTCRVLYRTLCLQCYDVELDDALTGGVDRIQAGYDSNGQEVTCIQRLLYGSSLHALKSCIPERVEYRGWASSIRCLILDMVDCHTPFANPRQQEWLALILDQMVHLEALSLKGLALGWQELRCIGRNGSRLRDLGLDLTREAVNTSDDLDFASKSRTKRDDIDQALRNITSFELAFQTMMLALPRLEGLFLALSNTPRISVTYLSSMTGGIHAVSSGTLGNPKRQHKPLKRLAICAEEGLEYLHELIEANIYHSLDILYLESKGSQHITFNQALAGEDGADIFPPHQWNLDNRSSAPHDCFSWRRLLESLATQSFDFQSHCHSLSNGSSIGIYSILMCPAYPELRARYTQYQRRSHSTHGFRVMLPGVCISSTEILSQSNGSRPLTPSLESPEIFVQPLAGVWADRWASQHKTSLGLHDGRNAPNHISSKGDWSWPIRDSSGFGLILPSWSAQI